MKSRISKIDASNMNTLINARFLLLRSQLTCRVAFVNDTSCKIIREQAYPWVIGALLQVCMINVNQAKPMSIYVHRKLMYAHYNLVRIDCTL